MAFKFTIEHIQRSLKYEDYIALTEDLVRNKKTTGFDQSDSMVEYTRLNLQRMKRIEKTTVITEELKNTLKNITDKLYWIVITEPWCGDAANIVPLIYKITESSNNIEMRLFLRDENNDIMNEYLTNGTKSIPILICLDENFNEKGIWGPRPEKLKQEISKFKSMPDFNKEELKKLIQMWYFNDKGNEIMSELNSELKKWNKK